MEKKSQPTSCHHSSQSGLTLIETVIAIAMLFVASAGIVSMGVVAILTTENQGHLAARTTEYAQDKMEQLIGLSYDVTATDTTVFPAAAAGGTGLTVGGNSDPATPVTTPGTGYVDYLCVDGNLVGTGGCTAANWYYIRVWQISTPAGTTNLKQITVTSKVRYGVGSRGLGLLPQSTVTTLKSKPF